MSDVAVEFDHVWKKFRKGQIHDSLRDLIPAVAHGLFSSDHRQELQGQEFWALKDVSFRVKWGESLGIIGPNGAGKSTILKLLSKVLRPTRGGITTQGRLSALIEIGAGFHPDLTGRENVFLNGAILGMTRQEISRKFDEIVEFSGIGDFIDTPVKRYSSGMYARLGFAVAAHVDPEVLLVDEVLSVGDMQFQERCLERMRRVLREGATVIFVSHNLQAVQLLCQRVVLLRGGTVACLGPASDVLNEYLSGVQYTSKGTYPSIIEKITMCGTEGAPRVSFSPGERAVLRFAVRPSEPLEECHLGFFVHRAADGLVVTDYHLPLSEVAGLKPDSSGAVWLTLGIKMNLLRGTYFGSLHLYHSPKASHICWARRAVSFYIQESRSVQGVCDLSPELKSCESRPPVEEG